MFIPPVYSLCKRHNALASSIWGIWLKDILAHTNALIFCKAIFKDKEKNISQNE